MLIGTSNLWPFTYSLRPSFAYEPLYVEKLTVLLDLSKSEQTSALLIASPTNNFSGIPKSFSKESWGRISMPNPRWIDNLLTGTVLATVHSGCKADFG